MDTLIKFLKTSSILLLAILLSCNYSQEETVYINELKVNFPKLDFALSDRIVGLELTVDIKESQFDSSSMVSLFKEVRKPLKKYPKINWVYMIVKNGNNQLTIIRQNPDGRIVFIKDRDK